MAVEDVKLRISTPIEPILPGRGFYQLEEDSLYVQIGSFSKERRFFSYLESDITRFDIDRTGHLIFIEVAVARRHWRVDQRINPPELAEAADVRWMDFRRKIKKPSLITSYDRTILMLKFHGGTVFRNYYLADTVMAQVDKNNNLAAVWITDIIDDLAGQEIGTFRLSLRDDREFPIAKPDRQLITGRLK